jgi:hypothetical protein
VPGVSWDGQEGGVSTKSTELFTVGDRVCANDDVALTCGTVIATNPLRTAPQVRWDDDGRTEAERTNWPNPTALDRLPAYSQPGCKRCEGTGTVMRPVLAGDDGIHVGDEEESCPECVDAHADAARKRAPYSVVPAGHTCAECGNHDGYDVVHDEGGELVALGTTYIHQEDAEAMAADLNEAYALGAADERVAIDAILGSAEPNTRAERAIAAIDHHGIEKVGRATADLIHEWLEATADELQDYRKQIRARGETRP